MAKGNAAPTTMVVKPKTKKGKRALEQRAPKLVRLPDGLALRPPLHLASSGKPSQRPCICICMPLATAPMPLPLLCLAGGGPQARADPVRQSHQPDGEGRAHGPAQAQGGARLEGASQGVLQPLRPEGSLRAHRTRRLPSLPLRSWLCLLLPWRWWQMRACT